MSGARRHAYLGGDEDVLGLDFTTIQVLVDVSILIHARTVKRDTCEQSARTRVGVDLGAEQDVGSGFGRSPDRTGRDRGVTAQRELVLQQLFDSPLIHKEKNHIDGFEADLKSKRSPGDLK